MIDPILLADFYKIGHPWQYPKGVTQIWANWTPRTSRVEGQNHVVHFGLGKLLIDTDFATIRSRVRAWERA